MPTRKPSYLSVIGKEEYVISAVSYIYYLHVHLERCMDVQSVLTDNLAPIHIESADLEYGDLHVSIASQQQQQ